MQYNIGDRLICRVNDDESIVFDVDWSDSKYDKFRTKLFEVIGIFRDYYIIIVSSNMNNSYLLDNDIVTNLSNISKNSDKINFGPKHFGKRVCFVQEKSVGGRASYNPYDDPLKCFICEEYVPWALPNQEDDSFICWVCRSTRLYKLT